MNDELEHYGVKGMKWGVRRDRNRQLRAAKKSSSSKEEYLSKKERIDRNAVKKHRKMTRTSNDASRTYGYESRAKYGGVRTLSNKELKDLNSRLEMEKKYGEFHPSTMKKGHDRVKIALGVAATATTAYNFAKSPIGQQIAGVVTKQYKKYKNS